MILTPNVVDLSHYDNVSDWAAIKTFGILGVINKATEGAGMTDKTFAIRRDSCRAAGMLYGAYHFLRPGDVQAQADHFLSVIDNDPKCLMALDHEDPKVPLSLAWKWIDYVNIKTGRMPILYSGFLIKQQIGNRIDPFWHSVRLWLSHYSANPVWPRCWEKPFLVQYTGDGLGPLPHNVPGISIPGGNGIDINSFDGSQAELAIQWAK